MKTTKEDGSRPLHIWTDDVEVSAMAQLKNLARLPFIDAHGVACMPDVHAGIGSTVGTVIATSKAIIPAAVGVDIGCGMNAVKTSLKANDLPDNLAALRSAIEAAVPLGAGGRHNLPLLCSGYEFYDRATKLFKRHPKLETKNWREQIGTLGSGNHFIELCIDENQDVWVMLHSGSRGIGNQIGKHFIEKAKLHMEQYFITLPDKDLAYLPEGTEDFEDYTNVVQWAQDYAMENRRIMMMLVLNAMHKRLPMFSLTEEAINCHHNYVEKENHFGRNLWVTRKGAIRARKDDLGIIPGSMGQKSYIVRGKGNPASYCSCSHGAGRKMSRSAARQQFTVADLEAQTQGVECRKDDAVLDEIPSSYKNIDEVMANQTDLIEVLHTLKQVLCVKGG